MAKSITKLCLWCVASLGVGSLGAGCSQSESAKQAPPPANISTTAPSLSSPSNENPINSGGKIEVAEFWSEPIKKELALIAAAFTAEGAAKPFNLAPLGDRIEMTNNQTMVATDVYLAEPYRVAELRAAADTPSGPTIIVPPSEFIQRMRALLFQTIESQHPKEAHFKLFGVRQEGEKLITKQRLMAQGPRVGKAMYCYGVVEATWSLIDGKSPKLVLFSMPTFVRHELTTDSAPLFEDITANVLGSNPSWSEQLQLGMNTWIRRIDRTLKPDFLGYHGAAVGDVDGDRLEDLYLCQPGGLPNLLFRQQADGTFVDISADAGVDWLDNSTGALLIDVDNDDDKDLVIATHRALLVMANDGTGIFSLRTTLNEVGLGYSPSAADFDADGDLDLLVLRYSADSNEVGGFPAPHPFYDARNGGKNVLLENRGDFQFVDVTDATGMGADNNRFSFAAAWEDFDNDGDQDVYIANDFGPNTLLRNDGGHFVDISATSGSQDWGFGMSAAWADYDRDGRMDLYVSSMFSGAGNQLVPNADFNSNMPAEIRQKYLKMVRGNSLLRNIGQDQFADVTNPMAEGFAGWAWGSRFADFNNDGWEDLYVANGYISQPDKDDL